ncbi:MAG: hypothetical protein EOM19_02205 [Candidatus Moranbacteria bacterium]|nr:hypothetical protein [Candidatus Moranbacteria bacterium]
MKVEKIRNIVERKVGLNVSDKFSQGYLAGLKGARREIEEVINEKISLKEFLETLRGKKVWENAVRVIDGTETIFVMSQEGIIFLDKIGLYQNKEATKKMNDFYFEDVKNVDGTFYIFAERKQ